MKNIFFFLLVVIFFTRTTYACTEFIDCTCSNPSLCICLGNFSQAPLQDESLFSLSCESCLPDSTSNPGDEICVEIGASSSPSPSPSPTPSPSSTPVLASPSPSPTSSSTPSPTTSPTPSPTSTISNVSPDTSSGPSSSPSQSLDISSITTASPSRTPSRTSLTFSSVSSTPLSSSSTSPSIRAKLPVAPPSTSAAPGSTSLSAALLFKGFPSDAFASDAAVDLLEFTITNAIHDGVQGAEFSKVFITEIQDKNDSFIIYSRSSGNGRRLKILASTVSRTLEISDVFRGRADHLTNRKLSLIPSLEGVLIRFVILLPPTTFNSTETNADILRQVSSATQVGGSGLFASAVISKMQAESAISSNPNLALFASSTSVSASNAEALSSPSNTANPPVSPFESVGGVSGFIGIVCAGVFMLVIIIALISLSHKATDSMKRQEKMMKTEHMRSNGSLRTISLTSDKDIQQSQQNQNQNHSLSLSAISIEPLDETTSQKIIHNHQSPQVEK